MMMQKRNVEELFYEEMESHFSRFVYAQSNPDYFHEFTTQQMASPLCEYIMNFSGPKEVLHSTCERLIVRVVETHSTHYDQQNSRCENMLAHMLLYLAAKVAFCSGLPNTEVVVRLLSEINMCDGGFMNLLMGAYYEPHECFDKAGVQSLFSSLDEGLAAFRYFLDHTNLAKKVFPSDGGPKRMVDLALQKGDLGHPAVYAIAANCPRTFKLLVEYGSNLDDVSAPRTAYTMLESIRLITPEKDTAEVKFCREVFNREHPEVLPKEDQTLMRLSRRAIRRHLNTSFLLPSGIEALPLPRGLKRYLHLDFE